MINKLFDMCDKSYLLECKKEEKEKYIKFFANFMFLLNVLTDMFEFENLPETLNPTIFLVIAMSNGSCGFAKFGDKIYPYIGSFGGNISKITGYGDKYVAVFLDGENVKEDEVVILKNNNLMTSDIIDLYNFAEEMTETNISINFNLLYTRLLPIFKVADNNQKVAIEKAFENVLNGKLTTFLSDLKEIDLEGSYKSVEKFDLTQPQEVDKIQYLTKYYDDIMRRFFTRYGHSMAGTQKMAQQNNSEISMNDTISMIYPTEKLKCLKECFNEMNDKFNTNISVRFSECWRVRAEKTEEDTKESETEVLENVSRETLESEVDNA